MTEYKERYRALKVALGDKDKQLDLAKRTIERLSGQCNAIEVTCHSCCQTVSVSKMCLLCYQASRQVEVKA